ncbi:hypothetical protein NDU88_010401 [Pleurodeles waltl]|uniref:Uncharacterized protein n=1 Tax=Pleurodeles waltl TaxID=8319 RepID=A0AAV7QWB3_PLEWA|nr:hypothetical protein NDU88_010401 [Pleurodeles waltl]
MYLEQVGLYSMEAEPHSILQQLRLPIGGRASDGGGATSGVSRVQDVTCRLERLPTGDAADVSQRCIGWARGSADGGAGGGGCSGDAAGAGRGASVCCGGGRHHTISGSLGWLILGEDAAA